MKLSIIIPIYNVEKYLTKCLDSVLNQDFNDWECILVNDGSTDKSQDICELYVDKDNRFKLINIKNSGVSTARNTGLDNASGEYIGFIDSDDYITPNRYSKCISLSEKYNADVVQCNIINIWPNSGKTNRTEGMINTEGLLEKYKVPTYPGSTPVKLIKTNIIKSHNIKFYENVKYGEDTIFMALIYMYNPIIYCCEDIMYYRTIREDSLVHSHKVNKLQNIIDTKNAMELLVSDLKTRNAEEIWINRINRYINNYNKQIEELKK